MNASCQGCPHGSKYRDTPTDAAGWTKTVATMVEKGAKVSKEDIPVLVDYLAKSHSPSPTARARRFCSTSARCATTSDGSGSAAVRRKSGKRRSPRCSTRARRSRTRPSPSSTNTFLSTSASNRPPSPHPLPRSNNIRSALIRCRGRRNVGKVVYERATNGFNSGDIRPGGHRLRSLRTRSRGPRQCHAVLRCATLAPQTATSSDDPEPALELRLANGSRLRRRRCRPWSGFHRTLTIGS